MVELIAPQTSAGQTQNSTRIPIWRYTNLAECMTHPVAAFYYLFANWPKGSKRC